MLEIPVKFHLIVTRFYKIKTKNNKQLKNFIFYKSKEKNPLCTKLEKLKIKYAFMHCSFIC